MMTKTILITGSSSGIGRATAKYFQEKGWNVVATMRTPEKEEELNKLDNVLVTKLDVLDSESITSAIKEGVEKFGKIDVLLNNAGYGALGPLEAITIEKAKRQFDVNVIGLVEVMKSILPHFRGNKDGTIINISSIGGKMTMPLASLYHGTKFAVEGITESLIYELEGFGIKLKLVEPGAIQTDFGTRSMDFSNDESIEEYQPLVKGMLGAMESFMTQSSKPDVVAEVIFEAATDGTNKLRYTAGEDAKQFMEQRKNLDDAEFMKTVKGMFGL